jgi:transcriptional regulator with XRE-family HTH domain
MTNEQAAAQLKKWRENAGMRQRDMARRLSKSQGWVARIERGDFPITVELFSEWARLCGVVVAIVEPKIPAADKANPHEHEEDLYEADYRLAHDDFNHFFGRLLTMSRQDYGAVRRIAAVIDLVPWIIVEATVQAWEATAQAQLEKEKSSQ